jgi:hypothetical protein
MARDRLSGLSGAPASLLALLLLVPAGRAGASPLMPQKPPVAAAVDTSRDAGRTPGRRGSPSDSMQSEFTTLTTDGRITTFRGSPDQPAWVKVGDMELTAGIIIHDRDLDQLTALPLPDTTESGEVRRLHRPLFRQGSQQIVGERMMWDIVAEKGSVWEADTTYEQGYYHGGRINALTGEPNYLTVREARFTTCDLEHPHYYFSAEKMMIIPEDKVIAQGIRFNLLGIPIPPPIFTIPVINLQIFPPLPFIVKSIRSGRQSGLLMPKYSNNSLTGVTLNDLGYYWAPSEYFDSRLSTDITETQGILLRNRTRYSLRYRLQGNIEANYNYNRRTGVTRWETRFNHTHDVSPNLRVVAQGNFSSTSSFSRLLSDDLQRRLERVLRSHVNIAQRFENGSSLSATLSRTEYLDNNTVDSQLPSLSFRVPRRPIFGAVTASGSRASGSGSAGGLRGLGLAPSTGQTSALPRWYENLYVDYGLQLISQSRVTTDSPNPVANPDTSITDVGLDQRATVTYSGKALGWLNVQPTINLRESWYFGDSARDGFQRRTIWNTSLRGSTKLYGVADHPFGLAASFRHVVEPSLSVTYSPDFQDLPEVPRIFGTNPGRQASLGFSIGQLFQMKRTRGEQEVRNDLFRLTTTGSYNALQDSTFYAPTGSRVLRKLSDLNSSLVMNSGQLLSLQVNLVHTMYAPGSSRLEWTPVIESIGYRSSIRLDSATLAGWLGLGRDRGTGTAGPQQEAAGGSETVPPEQEEQPFGMPTAESSRLIRSNLGQPRSGRLWNLTLSHDYGWRRGVALDQHSLDGSITFNLPKWTVAWSARYDFARREMVRQQFTVFRDLHCWEARLQVVPTGPGRGFWLLIGIKEIPEIKYERRRTLF